MRARWRFGRKPSDWTVPTSRKASIISGTSIACRGATQRPSRWSRAPYQFETRRSYPIIADRRDLGLPRECLPRPRS